MDFKLEATDIQGQARAGSITLDHGDNSNTNFHASWHRRYSKRSSSKRIARRNKP